MSPSDWIGILAIIGSAVGTLVYTQRRAIESMVGKRLDDLQDSIKELTESSNDHGQQLVRHETILEMNGLTKMDRRTVHRPHIE